VSGSTNPHANAHRLTLLSEALGSTEVVKSDRPQHWIAAFVVLFQRSSLIALGVLIGCLLTPWSGGVFVLMKLVALIVASYWLMHQEAPVIWTRRVVTDKLVRIIYQPWRIFGAEAGWSMRLVTLNTVDYRRPMWTRVLRLDCATVMLDGPGDKDEKFNKILWVSHWREFVEAASMDDRARVSQKSPLRKRLFGQP